MIIVVSLSQQKRPYMSLADTVYSCCCYHGNGAKLASSEISCHSRRLQDFNPLVPFAPVARLTLKPRARPQWANINVDSIFLDSVHFLCRMQRI